jgi:hypothetical protein
VQSTAESISDGHGGQSGSLLNVIGGRVLVCVER